MVQSFYPFSINFRTGRSITRCLHMSRHSLQILHSTLSPALLTQFFQEPRMDRPDLSHLVARNLGPHFKVVPPKPNRSTYHRTNKVECLVWSLEAPQAFSTITVNRHLPAGQHQQAMMRQPVGMPHRKPAPQGDQRMHRSQLPLPSTRIQTGVAIAQIYRVTRVCIGAGRCR